MNIFQKKIYKIHIKNNSYPAFLYWVAFVLLISIFCICGGSFLRTAYDCYVAKENLGYSHVVESSEFDDDYFSCYKLDNLVSLSKSSSSINCNFYIQVNGKTDININRIKLGNGEIAISQRIADKLNVSVGESIQVALFMYDEPIVYKVVEITPYVDDYYDFADDYDFSVSVIGFDDTIVSHSNGKYVGFLTEERLNSFMNQKLPYTKMYSVEPELEVARRNIAIVSTVFTVIATVLFLIYTAIINNVLKTEWRKYFLEGVGVKCLRKFIFLDKIIFTGTLAILVSAILFVSALIGIIQLSFTLVISVSYLILTTANLLRRDRYGKAH